MTKLWFLFSQDTFIQLNFDRFKQYNSKLSFIIQIRRILINNKNNLTIKI